MRVHQKAAARSERVGRRARGLGRLALLVAVVGASSAAAQERRFAVQRFFPNVTPTGGVVTVEGGYLLPVGSWEVGLFANTADDPLVVVDSTNDRVVSLVSDQTTLDLLVAGAPLRWLELGLDVPIVVAQSGDPLIGAPELDGSGAGAGLGDIRVVPRVQLLAVDKVPGAGGIAAALALHVWLPTGEDEAFRGEGFRVEPRLALEWANLRAFRLALNLGYRVRPAGGVADLGVDDTLTWGIGTELPLAGPVTLVAEVAGELAVLAESIGAEETPIEALLGLEILAIPGLSVQLGGSSGLVEGFGAPDWRAFLGVSLGHLTAPVRDRDGDGYDDDADTCPEDAEDYDEYLDEDGCPELDNDDDGVDDALDECATEPEDQDGYQDEDGCPEPDNDWDFVADFDDACPLEPEDRDGFEDEDGCPDLDNDMDGLVDRFDACPNSPESQNGVDDEDGCWDEALVSVEACVELTLAERIVFRPERDQIEAGSFELLDQLARMLRARTEIGRLRVEGHTDDRGNDLRNRDLSEERARAVRDYLVEFGVEADRLEAVGFGEAQPIADNGTEAGREANRRVSFTILEQEGCD